LQAAVDAGLAWLAIAGVIASVIGAFYYLRIIYFMYFGDETDALSDRMPMMHKLAFYGAALIMLVGAVNMFGIPPIAADAAASLLK
jgi:NADH-quinone oxidoreductase subunit N